MSTKIGSLYKRKDNDVLSFIGHINDIFQSIEVRLIGNNKGDNDKLPDFKIMRGEVQIGVAWKRKSKKDNKSYLSGILNGVHGDVQIVCFFNEKANGESEPDMFIYRSDLEPQQQTAAQEQNDPFADPFAGAPVKQSSVTDQEVADLPF